jgi:hypothetical protein
LVLLPLCSAVTVHDVEIENGDSKRVSKVQPPAHATFHATAIEMGNNSNLLATDTCHICFRASGSSNEPMVIVTGVR